MNIADGRGLKFELIISIFTLWIKSLLGSKLFEDQLHSRVWSLNPSSLSANFGSSVYLDLNSLRINCSTLGKSTSQGENQSTVRRQQQRQIPNMLFSCKSLEFSIGFFKGARKGDPQQQFCKTVLWSPRFLWPKNQKQNRHITQFRKKPAFLLFVSLSTDTFLATLTIFFFPNWYGCPKLPWHEDLEESSPEPFMRALCTLKP
jgi:hypothetical protein